MSDWNEFRVTFVRSWVSESRRRPDDKVLIRPDWPLDATKPLWGIEVDANGRAGVDVQAAVNGWREHIMAEIMFAASRFRQLKVGPFVLDDGRLEMRIGGGISMVLEGRMVLLANSMAEAEKVMGEFRARGKLPDDITILSDLETLAEAGKEEDDE